MKITIVADSSSNIYKLENANYKFVSLKIISDTKEYVDNPDLDVLDMIDTMYSSRERFSTSCPNAFDWSEAFKGEENIFALTITKHLSGSYAAAQNAAADYLEQNPNGNIYVIDSLSTGPEMQLIIEKLCEFAESGLDFKEIIAKIEEYKNNTHLYFILENLNNLAKNGRVNPAVAKISGVLGIRIVGKADDGRLNPLHKCRGKDKSLQTIINDIYGEGFKGGKLRISHCDNEANANLIKNKILERYPQSNIEIIPCGGLCSFYAERGGVLVGFES